MPYAERIRAAVEEALLSSPLLVGPDENRRGLDMPPLEGEVPPPLREAMRYSLILPGKRLRPVLLLSAYALIREDWNPALPFACAMEMIHTYSLVHDDLPALDNDPLRRGKPTNHIVFGENMAILAGDGLLNAAYETMLSAAICKARPAEALAAMREIAVRAGVRGMVAGQTMDIQMEGATPHAEMVLYIHKHKTADLFTGAMAAGLLLAGATEEQVNAGRVYGENLGLAFQIVDDLLDLTGDASLLGKQTGMDARAGKMTWPNVYGVERSRLDAEAAIRNAARALDIFGEKKAFLQGIAQKTLVRVK